jgi:hypothetical protein
MEEKFRARRSQDEDDTPEVEGHLRAFRDAEPEDDEAGLAARNDEVESADGESKTR